MRADDDTLRVQLVQIPSNRGRTHIEQLAERHYRRLSITGNHFGDRLLALLCKKAARHCALSSASIQLGKQFGPSQSNPAGITRKVGIVMDLCQRRVIRGKSGCLEQRVVLKTLGKDLPTKRIYRSIRAGVDLKRVAVGPVRPA